MKKIFLILSLLFIASRTSFASDSMIFWYPGEAGTTIEAQPLLDTFTKYIETKIPALKISAKYFNTLDEGLSFINKTKPKLGIVSYFAWDENKVKFPGAKVWLATNPLPHGKKEEVYTLVKKKGSQGAAPKIFLSEPMTDNFVRNILGLNQTQNATLSTTPQMLFKLKEISEGKQNALAILTPTESETLKKMSAQWTRELEIIAQSKPVPTACVILFGQIPVENELKKLLFEIKNDAAAQEMLEEMRLAGFSEP